MVTTQTRIACHQCDLLHRLRPLRHKTSARCRRCGALLYVNYPETIDRTLACAITGLVLMIIANMHPFLLVESQGLILETTLITGAVLLSNQIMPGLAVLVLCTSMIFPGLFLGALVYVLLPLKRGRRLPGSGRVFKFALDLRPWSMPEVFLLGILVSVVKLAETATIIPGMALFAFVALVFALAAANVFLEPHTVWERMDQWRQ